MKGFSWGKALKRFSAAFVFFQSHHVSGEVRLNFRNLSHLEMHCLLKKCILTVVTNGTMTGWQERRKWAVSLSGDEEVKTGECIGRYGGAKQYKAAKTAGCWEAPFSPYLPLSCFFVREFATSPFFRVSQPSQLRKSINSGPKGVEE